MQNARLLALALLAPLTLTSLIGCGDDVATPATTSTSATTGTGGAGGQGGGGQGGGGAAGTGGYALVSELVVTPEGGELIELWNPTTEEVDLTNYYISDNSVYFRIAQGVPWTPAGTAGSDFLARFPAGTRLAPDAVLVLATDPAYEATYLKCADFSLTTPPIPCGPDTIPMMEAPPNGGLGAQGSGILTNAGEMVMLFQWSGTVGEPVKDVDYLIWGTNLGPSAQVDKTGETGYSLDTPPAEQLPAIAPAMGQSLERCALETGETLTGGNGLEGHDETSEPLDQTFTITMMPSPGVKNACIQ